MSKVPALSQNAIGNILLGKQVHLPVVLQVASLNQEGGKSVRMQISDGISYTMGMLNPNLNNLVHQGKFKVHCIFELKKYTLKPVPGKPVQVMYVEDLEPKAWPTNLIGTPKLFQQPGMPAATSPQRPPPQVLPRQGAPNQQPHQQPRPAAAPNPIPILALNPYISRWTIKARATNKSEVRDFARGNYFSCSFLDADGSEIRAAFFAEAVDKFNDIVEQGKVYLVSNARIKFATKKMRGGCDFEMTIPVTANIVECADDGSIPLKHYAFVSIAKIENCAKDTVVDVVGVCAHVSALDTASGKEKNLTKLTVTLCDQTEKSVRVTMWGTKAVEMVEPLTGMEGHVVAIKDMKVFVSGGGNNQREPTRSLTCFNSSSVDVDPLIPEAAQLSEWWQQRNGNIANITCISGPEFGQSQGAGGGPIRNNVFDTFSMLDEDLIKTAGQKGMYLTIRGTIVFIRTELDPWYNACAQDGCNKKVSLENMQWVCNGATGCGAVNERCYQRYILSLMARDHTGGCWLTAFDDVGKLLLGTEATELAQLKASDPEEREFMRIISSAYFRRYNLKIRAQENTWQDKKSGKFTLMNITPLDPVIESELLIARIHKYAEKAAGAVDNGAIESSMTFD